MTFETLGRSYHLKISTAADLEHVLGLNEAHWLATGAPILSINLDSAFLDYLDIDDNNKIMCFEVKRAISWLFDNLSDYQGITDQSETLNLNAVNKDSKDGSRILTAASKMLLELRKSGEPSITLRQIREIKEKRKDSRICQPGIATVASSSDPRIQEFISDIIDTIGGVPHDAESNKDKGVDTELLDLFIKEASARVEWHKETAIPVGKRSTELMPLGNNTHSAYQTFTYVRDKIDEYFAQCEAVTFDPRIEQYIKPPAEQLTPENTKNLQILKDFMKESPLANSDQTQTLRFSDPINPYYSSMIQRFRAEVMMPVLDQSMKNLSKNDWLKIKDTFAAYEIWHNARKDDPLEKLGMEKLHVYLDEQFRTEVSRIIANSNKTVLVQDNVDLVEKILLYQANIITLANNFVSFPHLYDTSSRAVFEMGTLIIDGRRLNFSVKVEDMQQHIAIARSSNIYIIYTEITLENNKDRYIVAVPVTAGTKGNLCIGKRGVFCDLRGKLLDAKVIDMIENPISIGETLIAPFQRIGKLLTGKIEAMTTAAEKKLDNAASSAVAPAQSKGLMAGGLLMGGGVAFAAVTSAVTFFIKTMGNLGPAKTLGGILMAILAVIAPASIIALLKLRRRDLSNVLEGVGWAINARMRLTFKQGHIFTETPPLPRNARVIHSAHWLLWTLLITAILLSLVKLTQAEEPAWKRNVALGMNFTSGNSDTALYNIDVNTERKGSKNEIMLNGKFAYGETENTTTEENVNAKAQYNRLLTDRTFLYMNADYKYDNIAHIDYRVSVGPGVGYYFIKKDNKNWSLELGAVHIEEKLNLTNGVSAIDDTTDSINLRFVSKYDHKISKTAKIWETMEYLPEIDDFNRYYINYELGIEASINAKFTLRFVFEDKYNNTPAPSIERNDIIIKSAIVCNL